MPNKSNAHREIRLLHGEIALVDAEDYERVLAFGSWCATKTNTRARTQYAYHGRTIMHRVIMNAQKGQVVDHINHNGLDNRKSNLRICTRQENIRRSRPERGNASRFKGVSKHHAGNWCVRVIGFATEEEAAAAYNLIAPLAHGEFVYLNEL